MFLGPSGGTDVEGNLLSRLVYVSREKRPGYNHHKKAGAMNALVSSTTVTPRQTVASAVDPRMGPFHLALSQWPRPLLGTAEVVWVFCRILNAASEMTPINGTVMYA